MFIDARALSDATEVRADLCIIGAGPAGITVAREFMRTRHKVCLLESGGFEFDADTQALCRGRNIGFPYYDLDVVQIRCFGGGTNAWSGLSRPLDEIDFQKRAGLPLSGWPFEKAHLDPFYRRAHRICRLGPYDYSLSTWAANDDVPLPLRSEQVVTAIARYSPVRFGQEYREQIARAPNITAYLFSNVVEIVGGAAQSGVTAVRAMTLGGKSLTINAKAFVVAAGAIQNARLLLSSTGVDKNGIGNDFDKVGRHFMEHPEVPGAMLLTTDRHARTHMYIGMVKDGVSATGYLTFSPTMLSKESLLNNRVFLLDCTPSEEVRRGSRGVLSAGSMWNSMLKGRAGESFTRNLWNVMRDLDDVLIYGYQRSFTTNPGLLTLVNGLEQAPNPDSRVTLSSELDALGVPLVNLDWRLGALEKRAMVHANELIGLVAGRAGIGRVKLIEPQADSGWPPGVRGGWHQMGTTRMDTDAKSGVVDENCRVHGTANLFIAGSSVFPTGGYTNPTLTIVALALRLADYLKSRAGLI